MRRPHLFAPPALLAGLLVVEPRRRGLSSSSKSSTRRHVDVCGGLAERFGCGRDAPRRQRRRAVTGKQVVLGTTDKVISIDPAGAYDEGSWVLQWNIYQALMKIKPGTSTIVPDAANCSFTDPTTYTCSINPGLTFSNGDPLDAAAVVYSINRVIKINDPNGPSSLLTPMESVAATGTDTVVFTLKSPDQVWPYVLTTGAGNIVDPKVFPADKLLTRRLHRVRPVHAEQVHGEPAGRTAAQQDLQG